MIPGNGGNSNFCFLCGSVFRDNAVVGAARAAELGISIVHLFFIANAVRDLRGDKKTHRTMMINISRFIAVQNQITKVVDSCVRDWKREIRNYYLTGNNALQYDSFSFIKKVYDKYFKQFASDPNFVKLKHFTWEQIQEVLYPAISRIEVRTI